MLFLVDRLMKPGKEIMAQVSHGWDSDRLEDRHNTIHANLERVHTTTLSPGPELNRLISAQLPYASAKINAVPDGTAMDIWHWLQHIFLVSGMDALLGPENLFRQRPELESSVWEFLGAMDTLLVGFLTSILAPKACKAREVLRDAISQWVKEGHCERSSPFMRQSVATIQQQAGLDAERSFEFVIIGILSALNNMVPATFWSLMYLYQRPDALEKVRKDLQQPGVIRIEGNDRIINVLQLHKTCPLLKELLREVLRTMAANKDGRYVLEDTVIGDKYLIKKGGLVITNGKSIHLSADLWGSDAGEFNPDRFSDSLQGTFTAKPGEPAKRVLSGAWRGFGGGTTICPGRHLAQLEIFGFIAMFVLKFDMLPEKGDELVLPSKFFARFPTGVTAPKNGMRVVLKERPGAENLTFNCEPLSKGD
jgi:cytochrome P450